MCLIPTPYALGSRSKPPLCLRTITYVWVCISHRPPIQQNTVSMKPVSPRLCPEQWASVLHFCLPPASPASLLTWDEVLHLAKHSSKWSSTAMKRFWKATAARLRKRSSRSCYGNKVFGTGSNRWPSQPTGKARGSPVSHSPDTMLAITWSSLQRSHEWEASSSLRRG